MYHVTVTVPDEQIGTFLSRALSIEGVVVSDMTLAKTKRVVAAVKETGGGGTTPIKKKNNSPGKAKSIVTKIIKETFGSGEEFAPRQIIHLVSARGIPHGSFYTTLTALVKEGVVARARAGTYAFKVAGVKA